MYADMECSKRISEEYQWRIQQHKFEHQNSLCSSQGKHIENSQFVKIRNTEQSFEILRGGRQDEKGKQAQIEYKNKNESKGTVVINLLTV